jgi:hypothetical protein
MDNSHGYGTNISNSGMCEGILPVPGAHIKEPPPAILNGVWDDQQVYSIWIKAAADHPNISNLDLQVL